MTNVMVKNPIKVNVDDMAVSVIEILREKNINAIPVVDDKNLKNKKTFSYDFNKLNLNIKDNDELLRVYSCINMFKNHDNEKLSLLDHNIYTSLIIKFITKFGFFFDVYLLKSSLINLLFKFVTSNFYK